MSPMFTKFFTGTLHQSLKVDLHHLVKQYMSDYKEYCRARPSRYNLQNDFLQIRDKAEEQILKWIKLTLIGGEFVDPSNYSGFKSAKYPFGKKLFLNEKGVAFLEAQLDIVEAETHLAIYAAEEARIMAHAEYKKITKTLERFVVEKTTLKKRNDDICKKTKSTITHAEMQESWGNTEKIRELERQITVAKNNWEKFDEKMSFTALQIQIGEAHQHAHKGYDKLARVYYKSEENKESLDAQRYKEFNVSPEVRQHLVQLHLSVLLMRIQNLKYGLEKVTAGTEQAKYYKQLAICHDAIAQKMLEQHAAAAEDKPESATAMWILKHKEAAQTARTTMCEIVEKQPNAAYLWFKHLWHHRFNTPTYQLQKSVRNNFNRERFMKTLRAIYDEGSDLHDFKERLYSEIFNHLTTEELQDLQMKVGRKAVGRLYVALRLVGQKPDIDPAKKEAVTTMSKLIETLRQTLADEMEQRIRDHELEITISPYVNPRPSRISLFFSEHAINKACTARCGARTGAPVPSQESST